MRKREVVDAQIAQLNARQGDAVAWIDRDGDVGADLGGLGHQLGKIMDRRHAAEIDHVSW